MHSNKSTTPFISLEGLSSSQRQAAEAIDGPVLILAGAGSGKTRTVTYRIAHMVSNLNIDPNSILALSFTNKAAKEMQERVVSLLGRGNSGGMTLSTFHSLGVKILKNDITMLGRSKSFAIYDTSDQMSIVREILKRFRSDKAFDKKAVLSKIGFLKNKGIFEEDFITSEFYDPEDPYDVVTEHVYHEYQEKLKFFNAIDFDDILLMVVKLFKDFPEVAGKYSEKFKYIMIDEYQDTNPLQMDVVKGLISKHNNLCVVGDDDQSIYAFRGADITNILSFEKRFPGAKVVKLEQNYRSTKYIINLANKVIRVNKDRKDKTMFSEDTSGGPPILWAMADSDHEAAVVADEINKYWGDGGSLNDVAILYRSKTQTAAMEDHLRIGQIPYRIIGGQKFYDKKEVKDLMGYLSVIFNNKDELSLRRILNIPNRGIGTATLNKFLRATQTLKTTLFNAIMTNPGLDPKREKFIAPFVQIITKYQDKFKKEQLADVIENLIEDIDYYAFIDKSYDHPKQAMSRKDDVRMFVEAAARFQRSFGKDATLANFLEKLLLTDSQDNKDEDDSQIEVNEVTMMTLHSSKGLEFNNVYLLGMEENLLPHKRSIEDGDVAEERRLCYVGMTRAKKNLIMTYCKERQLYGKMMECNKSRFVLPHVGKDIIEQDRTTFEHMSEEETKAHKKSFFGGLLDELD